MKSVESIQDMYEGARISMRSAAMLREEFKVKVGLHQGLALSCSYLPQSGMC